ncbi:MAG: hypothetical protein QGI10_11470 [Vicinamibacterales bacterium]|nr:hypothetical protein [Vicinamibacterales bacterium]MDP7479875.1 hypothetical protein [Vicinamibacterales bacterium]HJN43055.1 hypothetical protein [Vicinamibacterales bacterium]
MRSGRPADAGPLIVPTLQHRRQDMDALDRIEWRADFEPVGLTS